MATLDIHNLCRRFGETLAVDNLDLKVRAGELVCLLGPSGSGKSTVLRMIGGFEEPTSGSILIEDQDITKVPPERRPTGMVFQSHALWPHMNVFGNVAFGLKLRRLPREEIRKRVEAALATVGLEGYGERRCTQLSGGQQQRVALARSLVLEPKILLLDEPFASLDQHLRERLREEVREIQRRAGITMVFVTHGQDEALAIADRIAVMRDGRLEQVSRPDILYREPQTEFVAGFVGQMNLLRGVVRDNMIEAAGLTLPASLPSGAATLALRPEDITLERRGDEKGADITRVTDFGTHLAIEVEASDKSRIKISAQPGTGWAVGMRVNIVPRKFAIYRNQTLARTHQTGQSTVQLPRLTSTQAHPVTVGTHAYQS